MKKENIKDQQRKLKDIEDQQGDKKRDIEKKMA